MRKIEESACSERIWDIRRSPRRCRNSAFQLLSNLPAPRAASFDTTLGSRNGDAARFTNLLNPGVLMAVSTTAPVPMATEMTRKVEARDIKPSSNFAQLRISIRSFTSQLVH